MSARPFNNLISLARVGLRAAITLLFMLFSLIAPGTMPEAQAGTITMVICTGLDTTTVTLDADGNPVEAQHQLCDWAGQATLDRAPAIDFPAHAAQISAFTPKLTRVSQALAQLRPDRTRPRGPPAHL
ncbi:hypothetical protein [uncultured Tateyamaria sp.]|uniref:hypothetical protein n=1 Tax=uncultured Tateyamaria sp. TaxID=455651 RepID=UPI00260DF3D1|nr:hypothetical protein [uncultured Tateyamaria sp.]